MIALITNDEMFLAPLSGKPASVVFYTEQDSFPNRANPALKFSSHCLLSVKDFTSRWFQPHNRRHESLAERQTYKLLVNELQIWCLLFLNLYVFIYVLLIMLLIEFSQVVALACLKIHRECTSQFG